MKTPLADRMRPETLDDMVGQEHLLESGRALRCIIDSGHIPNMIFYGSPGIGKTTLARLIADRTDMRLHKLNGTSASTADIRAIVEETETLAGVGGILLYLDEIQYFSKKQQQTLLEYLENGKITLIASTTENPYFYVYGALLSRATVFEFKPVSASETERAVRRAFAFLEKEEGVPVTFEDSVPGYIASAAGGDVRKAINAVELCVMAASPDAVGARIVTEESARELTQHSALRFDRSGDEHYDIISAYQKSMRGSDPDAALHYLARLLEAGDLPSACRRLLVCAAEDVGLANPSILPIVKASVDIALQVGLPEAQLPLADAVILVALSPKSNTGHNAILAARADVKAGKGGSIPRALQNKHYDGADALQRGQHYLYPHDYPHHWVKQQYLPDEIKDAVYYTPGENKNEQAYAAYRRMIRDGEKDSR